MEPVKNKNQIIKILFLCILLFSIYVLINFFLLAIFLSYLPDLNIYPRKKDETEDLILPDFEITSFNASYNELNESFLIDWEIENKGGLKDTESKYVQVIMYYLDKDRKVIIAHSSTTADTPKFGGSFGGSPWFLDQVEQVYIEVNPEFTLNETNFMNNHEMIILPAPNS